MPDADLFKAISNGSASIVTDRIVAFTERGIALESGQVTAAARRRVRGRRRGAQELPADIIVTGACARRCAASRRVAVL